MSLLRQSEATNELVRAFFPRAIEQLFGELNNSERNVPANSQWAPALDIFEGKEALHIQVELPGVDQKDIQLTSQDGVLSLKGEKKQDWLTENREVHRVERHYGTFLRSLTLPASVDPTRVSATYKNGVLFIDLPKREEAKVKEIQIQVN